MPHSLTWVEIDAAAVRQNLAAFARRVGAGVRLCPVVKANAYGHGLVTIARLCAPKAAFFAVASLEEAVQLRDAGVRKPVLILGYVPLADLAEAVGAGFHLTVSNLETLTALPAAARAAHRRASIHLELETGTHRLGFTPAQLDEAAGVLRGARGRLVVAGASTHFANIEDTTDHSYARGQLKAYEKSVARLGGLGVAPRLRHTACSAATILFDETHFDLARIGISLYGHWPSRETLVSSRTRRHTHLTLAPVLSWKTRVAQLQDVPAGASVGYG
ncbi:MAG TPA: alanine racemase, partial [Polyangia bacterium]